jgi:uncharacterized protein (TIGR03083 family)
VSGTESNPYARIKAYETREFDRLTDYLRGLDAAGWTEQSYCSDWRVYQVVSHIGSGSRIGGLRVRAWLGQGEPVTRETMQQIWGYFDALEPSEMFAAYTDAVREYLAVVSATPDAAGLQEVDGFGGKRPLYAYQLGRTWELACHSWDVFVARDRSARLDATAVALLAAGLDQINLPLDRERAAGLSARPIGLTLTDSGGSFTLDPTAERPRPVRSAGSIDAPLVLEAPDEELIRFVSGRHFLPGAQSHLTVTRGTAQDLAALARIFR